MPHGWKTRPYPYQLAGVEHIRDCKGTTLVADEMGLGKSPQTLWYAKKYIPDPVVLVVCPATIKETWARMAMQHVGLPAEVLGGMSPRRLQPTGNMVYVINYDVLAGWADALIGLKPDLIVFDEVHYLKNLTAKRTKVARRIARAVKRKLALSGTPMTNRPAELWPTLNILWPKVFSNFAPFGSRYCKPEHTPWGIKYNGATRTKELHELLVECGMLRRLKKDVLKDLPPKTRTVIALEIKDRREYEAAEKDFIRWLTKTHPNRANKARKAERLVRTGYLLRLAAHAKLPAAMEWIDDFTQEGGGKALVFGTHRAVLDRVAERYRHECVRVDGKVTGKHRQAAIDAFNLDERCRKLVGNMRAAGTGWSCTSSSDVMFVELDWVPATMNQAGDRVHGVGRGVKGKPSNEWWLVGRNTVEERLVAVLQSKQDTADQILDGSLGASGMNILDQLEEMLIKPSNKTSFR